MLFGKPRLEIVIWRWILRKCTLRVCAGLNWLRSLVGRLLWTQMDPQVPNMMEGITTSIILSGLNLFHTINIWIKKYKTNIMYENTYQWHHGWMIDMNTVNKISFRIFTDYHTMVLSSELVASLNITTMPVWPIQCVFKHCNCIWMLHNILQDDLQGNKIEFSVTCVLIIPLS